MSGPGKKKSDSVIDLQKLSIEDVKKIIRSKNSNVFAMIGEEEISKYCMLTKIRTDIPTLDYLWSGGITEGRWTTLGGNPSACKTTVSLQIIAALQKHMKEKGDLRFVFIIDTEGSFDFNYAKKLGVDLRRISVVRMKVLEEAFAYLSDNIDMGLCGAFVIDSLDGLVPKKTDDNAYNNTMGALAGAISAHLPNLFNMTLSHNVTAISIRQARVKMDGYTKGPEIITFSGGKAYRHFQDSVFIMKRASNLNLTYTPIKVKAEKTRSSRMGLTLEIPLSECGIDKIRDLVQLANIHGLIEKSGTWFTLNGVKMQGLEKVIETVRSDQQLFTALYDQVYNEIICIDRVVYTPADTDDPIIVLDFGEDEQ